MDYKKTMFSKFSDYRRSDFNCDVTLLVDKEVFSVHKLVLSAASDYFEKLFYGKMKEKDQYEIEIKGVTGQAFGICLDYIYEEKEDMIEDVFDDVLNAACMFQLWPLKDKCSDIMLKKITLNNCLEIWMLAKKYELDSLENDAKILTLKNAENLLLDENFLKILPAEILEEMILSEDTKIKSESDLFEALVKWSNMEDNATKRIYFCKLYSLIKLPLMSKEYFKTVIMRNDHVYKDCETCKIYSSKLIEYFLCGDKDDFSKHQLEERKNYSPNLKEGKKASKLTSKSLLILPVSGRHFQVYNQDNNTFNSLAIENLPSRDKYKFIQHNDIIYALSNVNSELFYCNLSKTNKWDRITFSHIAKEDASLISYLDLILVVGGCTKGRDVDLTKSTSKTVECYNTIIKKTYTFPPLIYERKQHTTVTDNNTIWVIGGINKSQQILSSVEVYNPVKNGWETNSHLFQARYNAVAKFFLGKIFVVGGVTNSYDCYSASVEVFQYGNWISYYPKSNIKKSLPGIAMIRNKLMVFGGGMREEKTSFYESWNWQSTSGIRIWEKSEVQNDNIKECFAINFE